MTGSSGNLLDHHAQKLIACITDCGRVLDIGAGAGKYGRMVKEAHPGVTLTAYETEGEYVERFGLRGLYHNVCVCRAIELLNYPDVPAWDLVVLGDVLEHMRRSEGLDLLHFLVYRTRYMWIQWPMRYIQEALGGHTSECHISVWTEQDIKALNADYVKVETPPLEGYAVDGYPNAGKRTQEILGIFNKEHTS